MQIRPIEEKCLAELLRVEGAAANDSPLGRRLAEVRRIPLKELSDWDLALLLRQRQAPTYLAPLAFERLERDIWFDAGLYRGDLLLALLRNRGRFGHHRDLEQKTERFFERAQQSLDELDYVDRHLLLEAFAEAGIPLSD